MIPPPFFCLRRGESLMGVARAGMIRSQTFGGRFRAWRAVGRGRRVGGGFRMARRERVRARLWEARLREVRGDATMYRRRRRRKIPGVASGGTAAGGLLCGRLAHGWKCRRASPAWARGRAGVLPGRSSMSGGETAISAKNGGKGAVVRTSVMRGRRKASAQGVARRPTAQRRRSGRRSERRHNEEGAGKAVPRSPSAARAGRKSRPVRGLCSLILGAGAAALASPCAGRKKNAAFLLGKRRVSALPSAKRLIGRSQNSATFTSRSSSRSATLNLRVRLSRACRFRPGA